MDSSTDRSAAAAPSAGEHWLVQLLHEQRRASDAARLSALMAAHPASGLSGLPRPRAASPTTAEAAPVTAPVTARG